MSLKKGLIVISIILFILGSIGVTVYLTESSQDPRSKAQVCPNVPSVQGVIVEFPGCEVDTCNLTRASCAWDTLADAISYEITVTEVETNRPVLTNQSKPASTTKVIFPINQGKIYRCDVVAINSCGSKSIASSHQLLCGADALLTTPAVSKAPTSTPRVTLQPPLIFPTATPRPTNFVAPTISRTVTSAIPTNALPTATPVIAQPGGAAQTYVIAGGIVLSLIGGILLLAL